MADGSLYQFSIDALNITTPDLAHLMANVYISRQCTYTHGRWTPFNYWV